MGVHSEKVPTEGEQQNARSGLRTHPIIRDELLHNFIVGQPPTAALCGSEMLQRILAVLVSDGVKNSEQWRLFYSPGLRMV